MFMIAAVTGIAFGVPATAVLQRAVFSSVAACALALVVALVIERLWTK
ncbi:MAG: hypothetical protein M5R36_29140 [Deltaproteobacteria bacterium]|nr:hypothetical protein [Deltaproteobacteria bacterium]